LTLGDELKVALKDHTGVILSALPASVDVSKYSDYAALVLGQSPLNPDSDVPITEDSKRALASLTIVTQNALPNIPTQISLKETNKLETQYGALIKSISGIDKCSKSSQSLLNQVWTGNKESLIVTFASQNQFAEDLCPTTTPSVDDTTLGKSVCVSFDGFVGSTDAEIKNNDPNSAIAPVFKLENNKSFGKLQELFPTVVVDNDKVTISGGDGGDVVYLRSDTNVDTIIRELAYIVNISSQLSLFNTKKGSGGVDLITFIISSANGIENNTKLINLIENVSQKVIEQYSAAYDNNLLSAVIISTAELDPLTPCNVIDNLRTDAEIRQYQITLWLIIALVSIVILGFGSTATMHILPDAALQGGMSTYWTHKK